MGGCATALAAWASGSSRPGITGAMGSSISWDPWPCPVARAAVGTVRSVHRSAKTAPRRRFGAFVYTVATRVTIRIATRAALGGTSASATTARRLRPLSGPSRLVGKTDSERVAPLPGWHLRQGVNPHEPLKSQKWDLFKVERTVASTPAYLHEHMEFHRFNPNATEICIFLCHDQVPVQ